MNESTKNVQYKVMLVDDSNLIRSALKRILSTDHEIIVVGEYADGQSAVDNIKDKNPDVILLDIEMPEMDGITALPKLLQLCPRTKIIMLSTMINSNAEIGVIALENGASDCIEKPSASTDKEQFKEMLLEKIKVLGQSSRRALYNEMVGFFKPGDKSPDVLDEIINEEAPKEETTTERPTPHALAIGCSTGGPQALIELFKMLGKDIRKIPIFITQHMPPIFTKSLASSITKLGNIECIEAADGMEVLPGVAYLAPGDYHMTAENSNGMVVIRLDQNPPENFCRPSVDPMLRSLDRLYGGRILVVIMTGMGQDGFKGVEDIYKNGGEIIIQDEQTSVVWGMPGAIAKAGLYHGMYPLGDLAEEILKRVLK